MLQKPTLAIDNEVRERVLYVLLRLAVLFWWGVRRAKCPAETTPLTKARRTVKGASEIAPHDESDGGPLRWFEVQALQASKRVALRRFALPPFQAMNAAAAPKGSDGLWLPVRP